MITGNDVPELVDFTIEERYVREVENDDGVEIDLNAAEPLVGGAIDIGEMVAQTLGVAVAPWPKSQTSADSLTQDEISDEHPFAGLAALRKPE